MGKRNKGLIKIVKQKIIDIGKDEGYLSETLSNFASHTFIIDCIKCKSMEGFLQSLKFKDEEKQKAVCSLIGLKAKYKGKNQKWWKNQLLFWKGNEIKRESLEYQELLNKAFRELLKNEEFKDALLSTKGYILKHSIGKINKKETVLTKNEFCSILKMLLKEIL